MGRGVKPGSMGRAAPGYDVRIVDGTGTEASKFIVFISRLQLSEHWADIGQKTGFRFCEEGSNV